MPEHAHKRCGFSAKRPNRPQYEIRGPTFARGGEGSANHEGEIVDRRPGRFQFDGGAGTYLGTGILAALITIFTLGACYPFAFVLLEHWRAKHPYVDGQRLVFTGSAMGLFGLSIKWFLLSIITVGIYSLWVAPRIQQWKIENTDFDSTWHPNSVGGAAKPGAIPNLPSSQPIATT